MKQPTKRCLDLRTVLVNHMLEDRCRDNKDGGREDDATVGFCEVAGVRIGIEPPDEEDADVDLNVVLYGCKILWLGFHESYQHNGVGHVDQKNSPEVCRRVQVPEVYH